MEMEAGIAMDMATMEMETTMDMEAGKAMDMETTMDMEAGKAMEMETTMRGGGAMAMEEVIFLFLTG